MRRHLKTRESADFQARMEQAIRELNKDQLAPNDNHKEDTGHICNPEPHSETGYAAHPKR